MDYNALIRKARSRNIRITKRTKNGRRYLTASELRRKLKRRKSRSKKLIAVKTGFLGGLIGGLFGRSIRKTKLSRKLRKGRKGKSKKICMCNRRKCKCKRGRKLYRSGKRSGVKAGALFALKTIATGAAIQLGSEAAKRVLVS